MNIVTALVIVSLLVCLTIIAYKMIDVYHDKRVEDAERRESRWEGKYYAMAKVIEKATNCQLCDSALEALEQWVKDFAKNNK